MSYLRTACRAAVIALLISFLHLPLVFAHSAAARSSTMQQPDYVSALSAVDHFLQAWQSGDAETGMALLSSKAKKSATTDIVEKFFSNEAPSAYEVGRGKILKHSSYEFPVVLITAKSHRVRRRFTSIIVLNTGGDDWAVDKLP